MDAGVETGAGATVVGAVAVAGRTMTRRNGKHWTLDMHEIRAGAERDLLDSRMPVTKIGRLVKEGKVGPAPPAG